MENVTRETWEEKKEKSKRTIESIASLLKTGQDLGINMDENLIRKIKKLKEETENRKLQVALIGGFAEGKTSIAAAWLGEIRPDMKIAAEESSDAVNVYDVDAKIQIADTPGLFGYKGKLTGEKYKEITRKYISEADIILYVMNPNNPIKESHQEYLLWMFRKLNVLTRTIFVLSQFDKEIDIEDENAYAERLKIKSENIKQRLKELIDLKQEEMDDISIIAVSANPFDKGIEYWLKNEKQYQKLSHIPLLQSAASEIISKNGYFEIMQERGKSIMRDISSQTLPIAQEKFLKIHEGCSKMRDSCKDIGNELSRLDGKVIEARIELREKIVGYFSDLIVQLDGLSLETYVEFFHREIGSEGIIVDNKINGFFDESVGSLNPSMTKLKETYVQETNHFIEHCKDFGIKDLLKSGGSWLSAGNITNATILSTRDFLNLSIKFKPWGAIKLADVTSKIGGAILSGLGIIIEGYEMWDNHKKEKAFKEAKNKMVEHFEGQRKELLDLINGEDFINKLFKVFLSLKEELGKMNNSLAQEEERRKKFEDWKNECVIVEAEIVKN